MRNNMKLLLYCTKGKPYLYKDRGIEYALSNKKLVDNAFTRFNSVNGRIVAECDFEAEEITSRRGEFETKTFSEFGLQDLSCLTHQQLKNKEIGVLKLSSVVMQFILKTCIYLMNQKN